MLSYQAGYIPGALPLKTTCHSAPKKSGGAFLKVSSSEGGVGADAGAGGEGESAEGRTRTQRKA